VVPPSRRKGRAYTVFNDIDPVDPPTWLPDLILQGRSPTSTWEQSEPPEDVDLNELGEAMQFVPNPDDWTEWKNLALAIFAATNGTGFGLFSEWSQRWDYYNPRTGPAEDRKCWEQIKGSPPDRTGAGKIFKIAREHGWVPKPRERAVAAPTYPDAARTSVEAARAELEQSIERFLDAPPPDVWETYAAFVDGREAQRVEAVQATTGIGKTRIAARVIAGRIKDGRLAAPVGYAVPTHRLGEDVAEQFREHGITAEVWRGRKAFISGKSGPTMCEDLGAVEIAEDLGLVIESACCRGKDPHGKKVTCPFYNHCAYQAQKGKEPDVWLIPHQTLFLQNTTLKGMSVLFIDESFRDAGTSKPVRGLTLDEIETMPPGSTAELADYRNMLAEALRAQPHNGGVPRANLIAAGLDVVDCTRAIKLEWAQKEMRTTLWPGMPAKARAAAAKAGSTTRHIRTFHRIWAAARELLDREDDVVSGRLFLANHKTENGTARVVRTRGIRKIATQYLVPTFVMDATLPSVSILQKWFPDVEVVGNIEVPMQHVHVRQVLDAPITTKKLKAGGRNLGAVRRYVLQRHVETGRGDMLVVTQQAVEEALVATGLPPAITVDHFNALRGDDQFKDHRLLIMIGRTQPGPEVVEEDAGALTGVAPIPATVKPNRSTWYDRILRAIRLRGDGGVAVAADQHPDPLAEDVRWQICEAELLQVAGRGRGVNRGPGTPLDIDIVSNVILPLTVDRVEQWAAPSPVVEMVVEGIWLESPSDMSRAWPDVWSTEQVAKNWLQNHTVTFPLREESSQGICYRVLYQHPGERQKWRTAWCDPGVVADPRAWLETRLGPLAGFQITTICFLLRAENYTLGGLDFATPTLTVRPGEGQYRFPWSTPSVEEVFLPAEEVADLWKLPPVIEGTDRSDFPHAGGGRGPGLAASRSKQQPAHVRAAWRRHRARQCPRMK
jgi:Primase C terminal 2 (PriCT-2)